MDEKRDAWMQRQHELRLWLAHYGAMHAARDCNIRAARRVGIGPTEISRLTGISRARISEIIRRGPGT